MGRSTVYAACTAALGSAERNALIIEVLSLPPQVIEPMEILPSQNRGYSVGYDVFTTQNDQNQSTVWSPRYPE